MPPRFHIDCGADACPASTTAAKASPAENNFSFIEGFVVEDDLLFGQTWPAGSPHGRNKLTRKALKLLRVDISYSFREFIVILLTDGPPPCYHANAGTKMMRAFHQKSLSFMALATAPVRL